MRKYLISVILICMVTCIGAIAQNVSVNRVSVKGEDILIRHYKYTNELIFGYGDVVTVPQNPNMGTKSTTIAIRDVIQGTVNKIAELPVDYKVYDARIVTIQDGNDKPIDFCVFCGTNLVRSSYYDINNVLITQIDSFGFVGIFCLDNTQVLNNNIYIRNVENTKHLFKMAAYSETNGCQQTNCGSPSLYNIVLDIVGIPQSSINSISCVARARIYPLCNGNVLWDNDIRYLSANYTERFVDITATNTHVVIASTFVNDSNTIRLRRNMKEASCSTYVDYSNNAYDVYLNTLALSGNSNPVYFKNPVRITNLTGNDFVFSFAGVGNSNNGSNCDGLFSFRVNNNNSITAGWYDSVPCKLVDVCCYPSSIASVALIDVTSAGFQINALSWNLSTQCFGSPIYSLANNSLSLRSVDCGSDVYGTQYLRVGGLTSYLIFGDYWKLIDHIYFTTPISPDCLSGQSRCAIPATVTMSPTVGSAFTKNYSPQTYTIITIPINNNSVTNTVICSH